jgi:hypothetical protein
MKLDSNSLGREAQFSGVPGVVSGTWKHTVPGVLPTLLLV